MSETPPTAPPTPDRTRIVRALLGAFSHPLLIAAAHFAVFLLARFALILFHRRDFESLSAGETLLACIRGLRFDAAIIFLVTGLPLFLLMLPFGWAQGRRWQGIWSWVLYGTLVLFLLLLSIDLIYFGYVHRHVGPEATMLGEEAFEAVALSGVKHYLLPGLLYLAAVAGLFWGWRRLLRREAAPVGRKGLRMGTALGLFFLMYVAAHGSIAGQRLKIIHAFTGVTAPAAYLALNGPFCMLHSVETTRPVRTEFYPWPEAVKTAQEALLAPGEIVAPEYPLFRASPAKAAHKPNVVVIMLESWDAIYLDAHRKELGLKPLGLSPHYDALSREGVLYSRFYASGQKSMDGMSALLCGFPTLPHLPYLGRGIEQNSIAFLGRLARQEGYDTYFLQTSKRRTYRNDAVAELTGFTTYLGAEDMPPLDPTPGRAMLGGACWDHETFAEANRRLATAKRPFLAFLYTASTHAPFAWPAPQWEKHTSGSREDRYRNSLSYADWALGQYIEGAKKAGYFGDTLFILTADHVGGPDSGALGDPTSLHHVPGLVVAPGLRPGVDRRIACQLDAIPTIADLAGWGAGHASLGRSLFAPAGSSSGAFCVQGEMILRIEDGGWVLHNFASRVAGKKWDESADLEAMERRLLSVYQVAATLVRKNRLCPASVMDVRKE